MELNRITISNKSSISLITKDEFKFGDLLQVEFNSFTYYFKVSEIQCFKGSKFLFITADQTGSSSYRLCDRIKCEDISEFTKSECVLITDQSIINGVRQSAGMC